MADDESIQGPPQAGATPGGLADAGLDRLAGGEADRAADGDGAAPSGGARDGAQGGASIPDASTAGGAPQQNVVVDSVDAETVKFVNQELHEHAEYNEIWQTFNQFTQQIVYSEDRRTIHRFAVADGREVSLTAEDDGEGGSEPTAAPDPETIALTHALAERRVLVLTAPSGAAKTSVALRIARELGDGVPGTAVLVDRLDRYVRLDLRSLAARDPDLEGRVVVFRNALSRGNRDMGRFFEKGERAEWDELAATLRERRAWLVFTAEPDDVAHLEPRAAARAFQRELAPHAPHVLAEAFDAELGALQARRGVDPDRVARLLEHRDELLRELPFTGQLLEFVRFYAELEAPVPTPDAALQRFHDTGAWLLDDLDGDLESWTFGFTLALAQCTRDGAAVPWIDFDRLHRHVRQWLRRELGVSGQQPAQADPGEGSDVRLELSDALLRRRCHADVEKNPVTLADAIAFRDTRAPQRLWATMLHENRRVLTALLPRLRDLAERFTGEAGAVALQRLAARVLGRLGEMDPRRVTVPLADRWTTSRSSRKTGLLGPLFVGVLASSDERYRRACLDHLKALGSEAMSQAARRSAAPANGEGRVSNEPAARLGAVIEAYAAIGDEEPSLALEALAEVAHVHLLPSVDAMQQAAARRAEAIRKLRAKPTETNLENAARLRESLGKSLYQAFPDRGSTLMQTQLALTALCVSAGPAPVLRAMGGWLGTWGWKMGVLVTLMYLGDLGVAEGVNRARSADENGTGRSGDSMLAAMSARDDEVRYVARFVSDLHECIVQQFGLPGILQQFLAEKLAAQLAHWVRTAAEYPQEAAAVALLLDMLARKSDGLRQLVAHVRARTDGAAPALDLGSLAMIARA